VVEVRIDEGMLSRARILAEKMGALNNSIRNGEGNLAGFLGEECVLQYYPHAKRDNGYDHDILLKPFRVEVKTKDRTVIPQDDYECSIANYNTRQDTDYYFFVSLLRNNGRYSCGYLLGYIKPEDYYRKAKALKTGELDPSNNFTVKADCWNLPIRELLPFR